MKSKSTSTHVVIVGAGFAGINAAKKLGNIPGIQITMLDKNNYHLFQPLLYQVAMAGLSPAEIASPIRSILAKYNNIEINLGEVIHINPDEKFLETEFKKISFDFLILACGASHSYFGRNEWEQFAPGMKTIEQATEIRRRVLTAFEIAEQLDSEKEQEQFLNFIVVGGGPTGVELTGSLCEIAYHTLNNEFKKIDPKKTKVILIEAGQRILASFSESLSNKAKEDLEQIGAKIILNKRVDKISAEGVWLGETFIPAKTVIWAAGVQPSKTGKYLNTPLDSLGRVIVEDTLNIQKYPYIYVIGDQSHCKDKNNKPLPGLAPVAIQQGIHAAKNIRRVLNNQTQLPFLYFDKGTMATIGKGRAISEYSGIKMRGKIAWLAWLFVHILYLIGFRNKFFVLCQWIWSYITFGRGARLITKQDWKSNSDS